jgi:hypothetical protein
MTSGVCGPAPAAGDGVGELHCGGTTKLTKLHWKRPEPGAGVADAAVGDPAKLQFVPVGDDDGVGPDCDGDVVVVNAGVALLEVVGTTPGTNGVVVAEAELVMLGVPNGVRELFAVGVTALDGEIREKFVPVIVCVFVGVFDCPGEALTVIELVNETPAAE